jgi:RNA polymerase sigma-70 factor, ECF subfamily
MAGRSARSMIEVSHERLGRMTDAELERAERVASIASHEGELLVVARLLVRREADARDLVQDTIETGMRHIDDLRDPARLRPWLISIEVRAAARARRRWARFLPLDLDDPPRAAGSTEDLAELRMALVRLPLRMRTAVVLHHMVGLTVEETARTMAVSANTTKFELKEGLRRLREMLQ